MKWIDHLSRQSKTLILVEGFLLVSLIGVLDYATGGELFFLEFYLVPVILLTWFVSESAGITVSMVSAIFWFVDDVFARPGQSGIAISYWNVFLKMLVFIFFTRILSAFKNALAREKQAELEKVQREMDIARKVQQGLLPQVLPRMETLDYFGLCLAAQGVGGDYYDFLLLSNHTLGLAIGDVSGKGISSALLMANLQATLRSTALLYPERTDQLLHDVNNLLCRSTNSNKYATFFYVIYEDQCRQITYVNAGHNPPLLLRNESISHLNASGTVIGLFPERQYEQMRLQLEKGDLLLLFTDGLVEARNAQEEEFGEERLIQAMLQLRHLSAREFVEALNERIQSFVAHAPQHDDLTVVAMKIL